MKSTQLTILVPNRVSAAPPVELARAARVGQPLGLEHDVVPQSTPSLSPRYLLRAIDMIYKQDIIALFGALVWYNQARISMIVLQLISITHLMDLASNH